MYAYCSLTAGLLISTRTSCDLFEAFGKSIAAALLLLPSAVFLGFVLSLQPQHGHHTPFHLINISHIMHLVCPAEYLPPEPLAGLRALCRSQIPLHVINHYHHVSSKVINNRIEL